MKEILINQMEFFINDGTNHFVSVQDLALAQDSNDDFPVYEFPTKEPFVLAVGNFDTHNEHAHTVNFYGLNLHGLSTCLFQEDSIKPEPTSMESLFYRPYQPFSKEVINMCLENINELSKRIENRSGYVASYKTISEDYRYLDCFNPMITAYREMEILANRIDDKAENKKKAKHPKNNMPHTVRITPNQNMMLFATTDIQRDIAMAGGVVRGVNFDTNLEYLVSIDRMWDGIAKEMRSLDRELEGRTDDTFEMPDEDNTIEELE